MVPCSILGELLGEFINFVMPFYSKMVDVSCYHYGGFRYGKLFSLRLDVVSSCGTVFNYQYEVSLLSELLILLCRL